MTTHGTGKRRTGASASGAARRQAIPAAWTKVDKGPGAGAGLRPGPGPARTERVE